MVNLLLQHRVRSHTKNSFANRVRLSIVFYGRDNLSQQLDEVHIEGRGCPWSIFRACSAIGKQNPCKTCWAATQPLGCDVKQGRLDYSILTGIITEEKDDKNEKADCIDRDDRSPLHFN